MKQLSKLIFGVILLGTFTAWADLYTAVGIEMSGEGATPVEAKNNAIQQGELAGFSKVISLLVGSQNEALIERPSDEEILEMVRDFSIVEEKNTATSYWGKMNVRFQEKSIQKLLEKSNQTYMKKAPPKYWVIPIWYQDGAEFTLEDENPFYQALKTQNHLSDFTQMILPDGDIEELIATQKALEEQDFFQLEEKAHSKGAEKILAVKVSYDPNSFWTMTPVAYPGTEDRFQTVTVRGSGMNGLLNGWRRLNTELAEQWQENYTTSASQEVVYYARINIEKMSDWARLEKEFKRMDFLENMQLQGVVPGQALVRFSYYKAPGDLVRQLNKFGWIWIADPSGNLGTLIRKEYNENIL